MSLFDKLLKRKRKYEDVEKKRKGRIRPDIDVEGAMRDGRFKFCPSLKGKIQILYVNW